MLKYRKVFYLISGLLVIASVISLAIFRLNLGIDFEGGTLLEVNFENRRPSHEEARNKLSELGLGSTVIQDVDETGLILRFKAVEVTEGDASGEFNVGEARHQEILAKLRDLGPLEENRFDSIGPVIGEETKEKSIWAISLVVVMIMVYIAWAFKGVSFPLRSWKYGIVAVIALFHDIIITAGVFSAVGYFFNVEVGMPFVAALLTILGYSVNDTIIIFDRIRENVLREGSIFDFGKVINKSVSQTFVRSINTSLTTLFVLICILLFGGETLKYFGLTLAIGIVVGTYSSIFLASPLLFSWSVLKLKK
ncbi:MAG: protein-export membrane protein SecF [Candidatus Spechtbacteria bacterium RIFCSPHIGHO2_02_FULL_43_15b]|uniref:Protein-export membrane protein SecF n=1 Tax=Candidatus Spechtbacteria bacterium RIFCSPHIGHO2_01_FULL_43_30 TaxID=1802158 RepID=A0A1G2H6X7_9BACT|nr:MAG: protein-export membrane protein SecF [Candidatus Spechtbacteria bacterium RIFCSPHIGHO2_01_FULL_43_30]OGZ58999.1 MAG: protein-export membrane protein SecF [Candidatus Spechtbacteria bacterium RIFCSPHIGHO2_02_FULL_43_15b]